MKRSKLQGYQLKTIKILEILLVFLILFIYSSSATTCFPTRYPRTLGGTSDTTYFNALDVDNSGNIIIGGYGKDTNVIVDVNKPEPIIVYMQAGGNFLWHKQIYQSSNYGYVSAIKFIPSYTQAIFILDDQSTYLITSINVADGSIGASYSFGSTATQYQGGILVDSSLNVYVVFQDSQLWNILKFSMNDGTVGFYLKSSSSNSRSIPYSVIFDSTGTSLYVGGAQRNSGNTVPALVKLSATTGAVQFNAYQTTTQSYRILYLAQYSSTILYGCTRASSNNQAVIKFTINAGGTAISSSKFILSGSDEDCSGIYADSDTTTYIMARQNTGSYHFRLVKVVFDTVSSYNTYQFSSLFSSQNNDIYQTVFKDSSTAYFVGPMKYISSPSKSYSETIGYLMSTLSSECTGCVTFTVSYTIGVKVPSTVSWTTSADTISSATKSTLSTATVTTKNLKSITNVDFSWCNTTQTTIVTPSTTSQTYDIAQMTGNPTYTIDAFTITTTGCTDASFSYYGCKSDSTALPTGVTFTQSTRTFDFTGATVAGTYTIMMVGTLNNGQTAVVTFALTITNNNCNTATISTVSLTNQNYYVTNVQILYQFTPFTLTASASCTLTYTLLNSDDTAYESAVFGFTSSNTTLSIYTLDDTKATTYNLKVKAYVTTATSITAEMPITVIVYSKCYLSTITPVSVDYFYYATSSGLHKTLSSLGWDQTYSADCPSLTYSLIDTDCNCAASSIFSFPSNSYFDLYTTSPTNIRTYNLKIVGTNGYTSAFTTFSGEIQEGVTCITTTITTTSITAQSYTTHATALTFSFTDWTEELGTCTPFTYAAKFANSTLITNTATDVVRFDSSTRIFTVSTNDPYEAKTYSITVTGSVSGGSSSTVQFSLTIIDACVSTTITSYSPSNQAYTIQSGSKTATFSSWRESLGVCGSFTYTATFDSGTAFPITDSSGNSIVTFSSSTRTFTISTSDNSLDGTSYTVTLQGACTSKSATVTFTITLTACIVSSISSSQTFSTQTYTVTSAANTLSITDFTFTPSYCVYTISYSLSVSGYASLPSFISAYTISTSPRSITIYTTDAAEVGTYSLELQGTLNNYDSTTVTKTLTIPLTISQGNTGPPYFSTSLSNIIVAVNDTEKITFPALIDDDSGDTGSIISVNFGGATAFVTGSGSSYKVAPTKNTQAGLYICYVTVTDNNVDPMTATYNFTIYVSAIASSTPSPSPTPPPASNSSNSSSSNSSDSSNSSYNGNQSETDTSKSTKSNVAPTIIKDNVSTTLTALIYKIDQNGLVTVKFSSAILIPANYTQFNETQFKVIAIPSDYNTDKEVTITYWNVTSMTSTYMYVQLNFEYPSMLSLYAKDKIQIEFLQNGFFIEKSTSKPISYLYITAKKDIPRQLAKDSATAALAASAGTTSSTLNTLMAASLQFLWGMINVLQLIVNMPLFSLMWETSSDKFSSIFAIIMLAVILVFPFFVWTLLWSKASVLNEQKSKSTFGSLYQELKKTKMAVLYHVLYLLRRIMFVSVAVSIPAYPFFQIQALLFQCIGLIIFDTLVQPFEEPALNKMEIFNEVCILGASYHLLCFTQFLDSQPMQYLAGWSIIGVTITNIAVNMVVMMYFTIKKFALKFKMLKYKIRLYLKSRKAKKASAKYQDLNFQQSIDNDQTAKTMIQNSQIAIGSPSGYVNIEDFNTEFTKNNNNNKKFRKPRFKSKKDKAQAVESLSQIMKSQQDLPNNDLENEKKEISKTQRTSIKQKSKTDPLSQYVNGQSQEQKPGLNFYQYYMDKHNSYMKAKQQTDQKLIESRYQQNQQHKYDEINYKVQRPKQLVEDFDINPNGDQETTKEIFESPVQRSLLNSQGQFSFRISNALYKPTLNKQNDTIRLDQNINDINSQQNDDNPENAKQAMIHYQMNKMKPKEEIKEMDNEINSSLEVNIGFMDEKVGKRTVQKSQNKINRDVEDINIFQKKSRKKFTR